MARYTCERCGADENTLNPPHLCKDIRKRHERQEKALKEVRRKLVAYFYPGDCEVDTELVDAAAVEIVRYLAGRDLGTD